MTWLGACLAAAACSAEAGGGVLVIVSNGPGLPRPDQLRLSWFDGDSARILDRAVPVTEGGDTLAEIHIDLGTDRVGSRRAEVQGRLHGQVVGTASGTVAVSGTRERRLVLVLSRPEQGDGGTSEDEVAAPDAGPADASALAPATTRSADVAGSPTIALDAPSPAFPDAESVDLAPIALPEAGAPPAPNGAVCGEAKHCQSGFCVEGACCDSACTGPCRSCRLQGTTGRCTLVPAGMDPRSDCSPQPPATCGRDGACNGMGACRLLPAGTVCEPVLCEGTVSTGARYCDGKGVCGASPAPTSCGASLCSAGACPVTCPSGTCPAKYDCVMGACVPDDLVLYWNLDEASGMTAFDTSGHGLHGSYLTGTLMPTPSADVPDLMFPNPRSREFRLGPRQALRLAPIPPALKLDVSLTFALHHRINNLDSGGRSTPLSAGGSYGVTVAKNEVVVSKRVANMKFVTCEVKNPGNFDNKWHHLAVTISGTAITVFVDGVEKGSCGDVQPIVYDLGPDLWVGRDGAGSATMDFGGNIDDVRIYNRALSAAEIAALARGVHAP